MKKKKGTKKGVALIELMITLGIIVSLSGLALGTGLKMHKNIDNSFKVDACKNSILHIVNDAKHYCKINNQGGYLLFCDKDTIEFKSGSKVIKKYKLPKGFRLGNIVNSSRTQIFDINNFGEFKEVGTIYFFDCKGKQYVITIRVGTKYAKIKEQV